jgi:hypothetical protein
MSLENHNMSLENLKRFEHDTTVEYILSQYIICKPENIMYCLVEDNDIYGLADYWAELNKVDKLAILDAIEISLHNIANFTVISTSFINNKVCHTLMRLPNNIMIPLDWQINLY